MCIHYPVSCFFEDPLEKNAADNTAYQTKRKQSKSIICQSGFEHKSMRKEQNESNGSINNVPESDNDEVIDTQ